MFISCSRLVCLMQKKIYVEKYLMVIAIESYLNYLNWIINNIRMPQKKSKIIGCNISDDLFGIKIDCFYDPSRILQLSEFVWMLQF